jgi:uncharacterized protein (TIGR02996 family)
MPAYALDGESWEIELDDKQLLITVNGKPTTRTFVSAEKAAIQYGKLIAEKTAAGWTPSTKKAVVAIDEPREPELESAVIANLDDRDVWAVYGDWYQQRQHPRGELIALQLAEGEREERKLQDAAARHLARYKAVLLGPLAKWLAPNGDSPLIWRNGFISGIAIIDEEVYDGLVAAVLAHPSGRFLSSLEIQTLERTIIAEALAQLQPARATLRDVHIRTSAPLEGLGAFETMQQLRTLSLASLAEPEDAADLHALTKLPATLEALHLRLEIADRGSWEALAPLFAREDLRIRHLSVRLGRVIDEVLTAISEGPFAPHLETLDFALTDPDVGLRSFLTHRDRFAKLQQVTLSLDRITVRQPVKAAVKRVIDVREDNLAEAIGYYEEDHYDEVEE